jgi:hypothetical protein
VPDGTQLAPSVTDIPGSMSGKSVAVTLLLAVVVVTFVTGVEKVKDPVVCDWVAACDITNVSVEMAATVVLFGKSLAPVPPLRDSPTVTPGNPPGEEIVSSPFWAVTLLTVTWLAPEPNFSWMLGSDLVAAFDRTMVPAPGATVLPLWTPPPLQPLVATPLPENT